MNKPMHEVDTDGYRALQAELIRLNAVDYVARLRRIPREHGKEQQSDIHYVKALERWFREDGFCELYGVDPEALIDALKKKAEEKEAGRKYRCRTV
jgi:hypothetical protein